MQPFDIMRRIANSLPLLLSVKKMQTVVNAPVVFGLHPLHPAWNAHKLHFILFMQYGFSLKGILGAGNFLWNKKSQRRRNFNDTDRSRMLSFDG